ncbi:hypothetical protein GON03_03030 [Nocardioides sp. MAH-18]|uniref:Uncharacterized protein n=1 Tax=Nocardioides agri TaxID=2682843 RepID=A0A6L6XM25_9ACTN|nr:MULTISPECIES: hypothetical protein [unclassified Nocardioides]MBA2953272.1 hypothetical protein [Nocardioides sp. CGMCC 1.13656]MVQ48140.1 hypothetical protein [Nocardioides sp. MAH-18]
MDDDEGPPPRNALRRAVVLALVIAATVACAPQSPDHSSWVDQADQSLEDVEGAVATVALLLRLEEQGKVPGKYQQVVAQDSETAVGATMARFGGEQPTPADDADYAKVTGAMSDASDVLAQTRIAIVRRDTAAYPGLLSELEEVHGDLERVRRGLR